MTPKTKILLYPALAALLLLAAVFAFPARQPAPVSAPPVSDLQETVQKLDAAQGHYTGDDLEGFKTELYAFRKPAAVVFGSARVLALREKFFSASFANLGGTDSLEATDFLARAVLSSGAAPQAVLFGIDFWWFGPGSAALPAPKSGGAEDGFDRFGAYDDVSLWTGAKETQDAGFERSLQDIADGASLFARAEAVSEERWEKFTALLDFMKERGIKPVLFLPPLGPAVTKALRDGGPPYLAELRRRLSEEARARGLFFLDFQDPAGDIPPCEFSGGVTGGETVQARLLLRLALEDAALRPLLDLPEIGWTIRTYAGRVSADENEIDFLKLGCDKTIKKDETHGKK